MNIVVGGFAAWLIAAAPSASVAEVRLAYEPVEETLGPQNGPVLHTHVEEGIIRAASSIGGLRLVEKTANPDLLLRVHLSDAVEYREWSTGTGRWVGAWCAVGSIKMILYDAATGLHVSETTQIFSISLQPPSGGRGSAIGSDTRLDIYRAAHWFGTGEWLTGWLTSEIGGKQPGAVSYIVDRGSNTHVRIQGGRNRGLRSGRTYVVEAPPSEIGSEREVGYVYMGRVSESEAEGAVAYEDAAGVRPGDVITGRSHNIMNVSLFYELLFSSQQRGGTLGLGGYQASFAEPLGVTLGFGVGSLKDAGAEVGEWYAAIHYCMPLSRRSGHIPPIILRPRLGLHLLTLAYQNQNDAAALASSSLSLEFVPAWNGAFGIEVGYAAALNKYELITFPSGNPNPGGARLKLHASIRF